jgi:phosphopantothenoylcysteine decarboxylase/phosphopantothenate--cysteine ligase
MGFAIAETCARLGAKVILISGPVSISPRHPDISWIKIQTAKQMYDACMLHFHDCDAAVLVAAVADFSPEITYNKKVKRGKGDWEINLKPTDDIAASLGREKTGKQVLAGFALETDHELENAKAKLEKKNFDFIVLNSLNDQGSGFETDTNKITIIDKNNNIDNFELKSKTDASADIVEKLIRMMS